MGILKSGILGPFSNKIGPAVGRIHRKTNVVTANYRKSNKPSTAKQLKVQDKFGLLSSFLSYIPELIKIGFKQHSKGKDPINMAYSFNYNHAFVVNKIGLSLNYPALIYSRGYVVGPESPVVLALPEQIEFNWLPQRQSNYCQYTDLATFMVYNPAKETAIRQFTITDRYAQGYLLQISPDFAGDTVHCYMSFSSKDGKLQGNSTYVGEVVCV